MIKLIIFLFFLHQIIIYEHSDFKGAVRELTGDCANMKDLGFNDRVSSIKVIGSV